MMHTTFLTVLIVPKSPNESPFVVHFSMCMYMGLPTLMEAGFEIYKHYSLELLPEFLCQIIKFMPKDILNLEYIVLEFIINNESYYVVTGSLGLVFTDKDILTLSDGIEAAHSTPEFVFSHPRA